MVLSEKESSLEKLDIRNFPTTPKSMELTELGSKIGLFSNYAKDWAEVEPLQSGDGFAMVRNIGFRRAVGIGQ
jgi:hypothetical protein